MTPTDRAAATRELLRAYNAHEITDAEMTSHAREIMNADRDRYPAICAPERVGELTAALRSEW
jgi:hypothetical protein